MTSNDSFDSFPALELAPVPGTPDVFEIHFNARVGLEPGLSPAEWDKFERDIAEAFEKE